MTYVISFLLTAVYLINAQLGLSNIVVLIPTSMLFLLLYVKLRSTNNILVCLVHFMIISLPFSWNPIWGGKVGSSIITWYYIWSGLTIIYLFISANKKTYVNKYQRIIVVTSLILLIYSIIPLANSRSLYEGIKEFIMIGFYILIILGISSSQSYFTEKTSEELKQVYIYIMSVIALGMIIQYAAFKVLGISVFGFKQLTSYGGKLQTGCHLLMEDASSGTIMLGAGAMLALIDIKKNKAYIFELIIIIIGIACSGRRTGALTLVLVMGLYYILGVKSLKARITSFISFGGLSLLLLKFMSASRSITNSTQMLDDNGRFKLWKEGLALFIKNPWIGYGFDNVYLEKKLMPSRMIVHNTFIRWLDMGGIFYATLLLLVFMTWLIMLKKYKIIDYYWCLIYVIVASMLIPDVLNARFVYVIVIMSFVPINKYKEVIKNEDSNYNDT